MIEKFEKNLYNFFDEIIYVNSNPATVQTQIIEKIDGQIKSKYIIDNYDLQSIKVSQDTLNLFDTECGNPGIIENIQNFSEEISVDFYPKNIIQKLLKKKKKNLDRVLSEYSIDDYFLVTNVDLQKFIPSDFLTYYTSNSDNTGKQRLTNKIIVAKKYKVVINTNLEDCDGESVVQFWINPECYKVINLK